MPVLLVRPDRDHVTRSDLLDRSAPALMKSGARGDDQRLTKRMRVPVAASARLERDERASDPPGLDGLEERIDSNGSMAANQLS